MNMKIKTGLLAVCCMLILFSGCEKTKKSDIDVKALDKIQPPATPPILPKPSGGLALSIDSTAITADEIIEPIREPLAEAAKQTDYEHFRTTAKPMLINILLQKIGDIRLYEKAKEALPENIDQTIIDKIVEQEVQRFISQYGGDYATVEKMLKTMHTNWQDFYKQTRRGILIQSFVSDEVKIQKPITHSELIEYYDKIKGEFYTKEGQIEFRLIDLEVGKFKDPNDPNADAGKKAMKLAMEVSERIRKGEDFGELAKKYSNDQAAQNGGLWKPIRPGSLAEPYDAIEKATENMAIGQFAGPIAAGNHIFLIRLENKQIQSCEPFEKVQSEVEGRLMFEKRKKLVDDMMAKIIAQVDLSYADDFIEYCMQKAYREIQG
ncbi:MAG: peptidylprolyl isomerase [Sedimentisphaerales bacterium]|jgi:parvulin-like peptidyl-prolyl isomerase